MQHQMKDREWSTLLNRIAKGRCTPFLGAGACYPALPTGSTIAREWAKKYRYPLDDRDNLIRVAEFVAIKHDPMAPKEAFLDQYLSKAEPPNFGEKDEIHGLLADLPLPVYMTTNYDDFMMRALYFKGKTKARRELLPWNKYIDHESVFDVEPDYEPTPDEPVVFHLHGNDTVPESLVLTEEDYLAFLVNYSRDPKLVPASILKALATTSLLFIGYSLQDWSFRVLFQGVIMAMESNLRRISVTVQLPPDDSADSGQNKAQEYLGDYFETMKIRVYWGTARQFAAELRQRWEGFTNE